MQGQKKIIALLPKGSTTKDWEMQLHLEQDLLCFGKINLADLKGPRYPWDELLVAKFRLILKKAGKTIRPFRYNLNQIPYDYTMEVTNRFKGLDLIECLRNYG